MFVGVQALKYVSRSSHYMSLSSDSYSKVLLLLILFFFVPPLFPVLMMMWWPRLLSRVVAVLASTMLLYLMRAHVLVIVLAGILHFIYGVCIFLQLLCLYILGGMQLRLDIICEGVGCYRTTKTTGYMQAVKVMGLTALTLQKCFETSSPLCRLLILTLFLALFSFVPGSTNSSA